MFMHEVKYHVRSVLRSKEMIFWLIAFPIILGTLFKMAFTGLYEKNTKFSTIPAAVVENSEDPVFRTVMDSVSSGDNPLIDVKYLDEKEALKLLENDDIEGIIYIGSSGRSLTVNGSGMNETILKSFLDEYAAQETIIKSALMHDPDNAGKVIEVFASDAESCREVPVTQGNTDYFVQYFYNLLAMVALYTAVLGQDIVNRNHANMSAIGARKTASPLSSSVKNSAGLTGSSIIASVCTVISVSYIRFVLGIDFGQRLLLVYLSAIVGGILGTSFGFMIGSLIKLSVKTRTGVVLGICMISSFFSGLMIGEMKAYITKIAPWFNDINPASVISDSFHCLNMYSDYRRYITKMVTMLIMIVVFSVIGLIYTRRNRYASI